MATCLRSAEERHEECTETEDRGYEECTQTRDEGYRNCCDWWPCSWTCAAWVWVSDVVCVSWTWVSVIVCVAWTWVTTAVCVARDVVTTLVNGVLVTVEALLGWVLSAVAFLLNGILVIPVVGAVLRWLLAAAAHVVFTALGAVDALLGLVGIRPEKILRVCTVVLRDERGRPVAGMVDVRQQLQLAVDVYKRDANVRIVPSGPLRYSSGFVETVAVDDTWIVVDELSSVTEILEVGCNADGIGADLLTPGSRLQLKAAQCCFFGGWRRLVGYGAPLTCFVIRDVVGDADGEPIGCALWITDYVTIDQAALAGASPRTLGHELGHACNLWHVCVREDRRNLMATTGACDPESGTEPDRLRPRMSNAQVLLVRASKHVTYF